MSLLPHPPIFLSLLRVTDIWFLLGLGATYEFLCRLYLLGLKRKPRHLLELEADHAQLAAETNAKRQLGPQAFVETAKLERQVLGLEKKMEQMRTRRKTQIQSTEKLLLRTGNFRLSVLVGLLWYGVAVLELDTISVGTPPPARLKNLFFPISYSGFGYRLSRFGLPSVDSLGALVVMWSAQVTMGAVMDAVDAYYLAVR